MELNEKIKDECTHILLDYESILNYLITCRDNKLDFASYMGIMPFLCMYVAEGYKYLSKNKIIKEGIINKKFLSKIEKCRATGVKLYAEFNENALNSINDFNRNEYIKFFKKAFPTLEPQIFSFVDNYFICFLDNLIVGNYHLYSKMVLNLEIGSYVNDIKPRVYEFSYNLVSFISKIILGIDKNFKPKSISEVNFEFKYLDLNMAYNYNNFSIKNNPPILMAFIDVLSVLNSYRKIFCNINKDFIFEIKIKYVILFYSIISIKDIVNYCAVNNIDIHIDNELIKYVLDVDSKYIRNNLRKYCMHYDFPKNEWKPNLFTSEFESTFNMPIVNISINFDNIINKLSTMLQSYIIVEDFVSK